MTLSVPLTLNLTQKKVFTGYAPRTARYAVQNRVTANPLAMDGSSNPDGDFAAHAFILAPAGGPDMEGLVEMLDLSNPEHCPSPGTPCSTSATQWSTCRCTRGLHPEGQRLRRVGARRHAGRLRAAG